MGGRGMPTTYLGMSAQPQGPVVRAYASKWPRVLSELVSINGPSRTSTAYTPSIWNRQVQICTQ
eukprot:11943390-Alexandrium_andersonii.AAC.1